MPKVARTDIFPDWNEGDQFTAAAFNYLDVMLKLALPVASEKELRNKFAKLGIGTEKGFDINSFDENTQKAIEEGVKDELPPVNAFWSLSMYDGKTQLFINNQLDRYLLNSNNMEAYEYNNDGSLTLYIQKDSPGKELEANWLPAPDGPFYCVMRLYGPEEEALKGSWINPPMLKN